jgi:hypothetical protein
MLVNQHFLAAQNHLNYNDFSSVYEGGQKEVFAKNREKNPRQASLDLVVEIKQLGLEPFTPPSPLEPIKPEDMRLRC